MKNAWRIIRNLLGVCGGVTLFLAASTSDYYLLELGVQEPGYIRTMIAVGFVLMIPTTVHSIMCLAEEYERSK